MKRGKILALVAAVTALAILGLPSAFAGHNGPPKTNHGNDPLPPPAPGTTALAECVVNGRVTLAPGVSSTPTHGHYTFNSTTLECVGVDPTFDGTYDVEASGGTDGPDHAVPDSTPGGGEDHGEDCERGWSNAPGSISATHKPGGVSDGHSGSGTVEFSRVGTVVEAWGQFPTLHGGFKFHATLQFTPDPGQDCAVTPVTGATLTGEATLTR